MRVIFLTVGERMGACRKDRGDKFKTEFVLRPRFSNASKKVTDFQFSFSLIVTIKVIISKHFTSWAET